MHYYKRNIGDYAKKAGRLTMLQHGAYTLLLDACYDREQFPTREEAIDWLWASSTAEIEAVDFVLSKFFHLVDGRYVDNKIVSDIADWNKRGWTPNDPRISSPRLPIDAWKLLRIEIFARDNYTCTYCGKRGGNLECDHIHPISKGGSNDASNLATACKDCNRSKGNKTLQEWDGK